MDPSPPSRVKGCLLYFFLFMGYGCVSPFLPLIWRSKGLSEHQVGVLGAIKPVASFFATPVLCAFADKHSIQQQLVYVAMLLFAVTRPCVLLAGTFLTAAAVEASCSFSKSPIGSLIDSAVRHSYGGDGFGALRLWGAIGFGIASLLGGYVCDLHGGSYTGVMVVFVANVALALVASTGVPVGKVKDEKEGTSAEECELVEREGNQPQQSSVGVTIEQDGESDIPGLTSAGMSSHTTTASATATASTAAADGTSTLPTVTAAEGVLGRYDDDDVGGSGEETQSKVALLSSPVGTASKSTEVILSPGGGGDEKGNRKSDKEENGVLMAVRVMVSTNQSASFFTAVGLSGMGAGVIDTFLFIRLEELGGSHVLCGLARLIMCVAEVPFFSLSGPLITRLGVRGVMASAQLGYLTRFIYYSALREPWWVLPAEVLHGLTFAAMWAASTDYAHSIAPAHLRTTIQGSVSGLHWGLGFGLGAVLGGVLYAELGAQRCFAVSAVLPSLSLFLLVLPTVCQWFNKNKRFAQTESEWLRNWWGGRGRDSGGGRSYQLVGKVNEPFQEDSGRDDDHDSSRNAPSMDAAHHGNRIGVGDASGCEGTMATVV